MTTGDPRGVFYDISDTEEQAVERTQRSMLMIALTERIAGLSRAQAAKALGINKSRVADLLAGKMSKFSLAELQALGSVGQQGW
jgi:predicted XRE-type DNA-binding protein